MKPIEPQTRKLAAIAYGEASTANDANEIGGIAWAVRGSYKYVWCSTAAYGKTIFGTHDADCLKATGGKAYR